MLSVNIVCFVLFSVTLCYVFREGVFQFERLVTHITDKLGLIMKLLDMGLQFCLLLKHRVADLARLLLRILMLFPHVSR